MKQIFTFILLLFAVTGYGQQIFVNEIHYDNDGADTNEGIEIAGPAGTDLSGYSLVVYNGNGGTSYSTVNLSGILTNQSNGFGTAFFAISGLQNGAPDGIALFDGSSLVQFLSYEGSFTAVGGVADGVTSTDIGIAESSTTPAGTSLQLSGEGSTYEDFTWAADSSTYDGPNVNQLFTNPIPRLFINEIHYDNDGADVNEGVEVAGTAGLDLTGWSLVAYNGNGGSSYASVALSGVLSDQQGGFGTAFFAISGLQNGAPDGIALVTPSDSVYQFLSYEGSFEATNGPAMGITSTDIGVSESSSTPLNFSLQLTGIGLAYPDFTWSLAMESTYDSINTDQTFGTDGGPVVTGVVFINELHYDNDGSDTGEGVELAGTAGVDLIGYSLVSYNGNGGTSYGTLSLSGIIPDQDEGFGTIFFPISGLQNGAPDGVALVDNEGAVIEFISYEGSLLATDGPAAGLTSVDIVVSETSTSPVGFSLQLIGTGTTSADFTWTEPIASTYDAVNTGQSFGGIIEPPVSDTVSVAQARTLSLGTKVILLATITATDQFGGPAYVQDETAGIPVFDSQIHGAGNFAIGDQLWISAELGIFSSQIQLVSVTALELVGHEVIAPTAITLSQLAGYEGQLITINNVDFDLDGGLLYPNSNYGISDSTGNAELRIDAEVDLVGRLLPEGASTITGVVGRFQSTLQILPRFIADMPGAQPYVPAGGDIPFENTVDVTTWNMEFFGSQLANYGPADVQLQRQNALAVLSNLHADVIAVQEVSDEVLFHALVAEIPQYQSVCSQVYSYSFEESDGTFPPQKLCFIYNTETVNFKSDRVMFDQFYTDARTGLITDLDNHPGSNGAASFWSSGRLPYMLTADVTVRGVTQEMSFVNIHAKSGASANDLARKRYDIQVLKDSLDTQYGDKNVIILGDYNDDVDESIGGGETTYKVLIDDVDGYNIPTISLSEAGFRSYLFADNMIDHITISNELFDDAIYGSENTFIPFNLIYNYSGTTSDHLPVSLRFDMVDPLEVSVTRSAQQVFSGYNPLESATLSASVAGGATPYSYTWSTGQTDSEISVAPSENTVYTLTVTDASGQSVTQEVSIEAIDVACGRHGDRVEVCFRGHTLCISEYAVSYLLRKGATLGSCNAGELPLIENVYINPNPFEYDFNVIVESNGEFEMNIVMKNIFGREVLNEVVSVPTGQSTHNFVPRNAPRGLYFIQLINTTSGVVEKMERVYKRR